MLSTGSAGALCRGFAVLSEPGSPVLRCASAVVRGNRIPGVLDTGVARPLGREFAVVLLPPSGGAPRVEAATLPAVAEVAVVPPWAGIPMPPAEHVVPRWGSGSGARWTELRSCCGSGFGIDTSQSG
ncbi:hypothetical protein [Nocardia carnea]|uniref:hypothetical protein n=1 Tax=Nocardia carnea TaxID=37328 RepID=UPI0024582389|nr:hypothetical protein [Nocardia carnea]